MSKTNEKNAFSCIPFLIDRNHSVSPSNISDVTTGESSGSFDYYPENELGSEKSFDDSWAMINSPSDSSINSARSDISNWDDEESLVSDVMEHTPDLCNLIQQSYNRSKKSGKDGWIFIEDSTSIKNTGGFYGQLWINKDKKQLSLVCSGTKINCNTVDDAESYLKPLNNVMRIIKDITNNVQLAMNLCPTQYKRGVEKFVDRIFSDMGALSEKTGIHIEDLKQYQLICTGHSLGGVLADGAGLYCHKYEDSIGQIKVITLENPGSHNLIHSIAKSAREYLSDEFSLESIKAKFVVINNKKNLINSACKQFGKVYENIVEQYTEFREQETNYRHEITAVCNKIFNDLSSLREYHRDTHFENMQKIELRENWDHGHFIGYLQSISDLVGETNLAKFVARYPLLQKSISSIGSIIVSATQVCATNYDKALDFMDLVSDKYDECKMTYSCVEEFVEKIHPKLYTEDDLSIIES
ncbi:MAG: hypothetical protein SFT91_06275 [Rickettsiaceae bacterium]|nr:hypothetical protein [Rickettsiaceae bacterium]